MPTQQQQQQQQLIVLQKKVFTAYLQPLLAKHEAKKPITYEDLIGSWQAAVAELARARESPTTSQPHVVSVVRALLCLLLVLSSVPTITRISS